jgi:hypothetical protein
MKEYFPDLNCYFQQDGAGPHREKHVIRWLNRKFPDRWIGKGGPLEWPARSPDLTPCDFWLWGSLREKVYAQHPSNLQELQEKILHECGQIPIETCRSACHAFKARLEKCVMEKGGHVE